MEVSFAAGTTGRRGRPRPAGIAETALPPHGAPGVRLSAQCGECAPAAATAAMGLGAPVNFSTTVWITT